MRLPLSAHDGWLISAYDVVAEDNDKDSAWKSTTSDSPQHTGQTCRI